MQTEPLMQPVVVYASYMLGEKLGPNGNTYNRTDDEPGKPVVLVQLVPFVLCNDTTEEPQWNCTVLELMVDYPRLCIDWDDEVEMLDEADDHWYDEKPKHYAHVMTYEEFMRRAALPSAGYGMYLEELLADDTVRGYYYLDDQMIPKGD